MKTEEAKRKLQEIMMDPVNIDDEKRFVAAELSRFIYEETGDIRYLSELGNGLTEANPDVVKKIHEIKIAAGDEHSCFYLGDMYYGGLFGRPDYQKAYEYFKRAAMTRERGDGSFENPYSEVHNYAKIRLAGMYKNGEYVDKDQKEYERLINEVYEEVKDKEWYDGRADGLIAKSKLEFEKGNIEEGLDLLYLSREDIFNMFDSTQSDDQIMELKEVNDLIYSYEDFDPFEMTFMDITEMLKYPVDFGFRYKNRKHLISIHKEAEDMIIEFEGQRFNDPLQFIMEAKMDGQYLRAVLPGTYEWEVVR